MLYTVPEAWTDGSTPHPWPDQRIRDAIEEACDLDRAWFADHPGEDYYVREPVRHETCLPGYPCRQPWLIAVSSYGPGLRSRGEVAALDAEPFPWERRAGRGSA
jgi:hypothetical protein